MTTDKDVQEFWEEVRRLELANQTPDPVHEYRLYYDDHGEITASIPVIVNRPLPDLPTGPYITVSLDEYRNSANQIVRQGRLEKKRLDVDIQNYLVKSTKGFRVVKNNAALLLNNDEQYQDTEFYDRRDN